MSFDAAAPANAGTHALHAYDPGHDLPALRHRTLPSQTHFLLLDPARNAAPLERHLFERGVIVRPMGGYGLDHALRISIGSRAENLRLLEALP